MTKLERVAASRGQSLTHMLREMAASARPYKELAAECGVTYVSILMAMKKRGISKPDARAYPYQGVIGTTADHCRRLGYDYNAIERYCQNYGGSYKSAMLRMYANADKQAA